MKSKFHLIAGAVLAFGLSLPAWTQTEPGHPPLGAEKDVTNYLNIDIKNLKDESLGHIADLGVDLVNGRIVLVFVASDDSLKVDNKIVAVPPVALIPDLDGVYRLNVSADLFRSAPAVDLSKWRDEGAANRIAASYRLFGHEPYFLDDGAAPAPNPTRPKLSLGNVERASKILDMPVQNPQGEKFGKVWSLNLDILKGRIQSVIVIAPGNLKTRSVIPAMALAFNPARDTLLLDDSKMEYSDEPRYVFTAAAYGNTAESREEPYTGPHTSVALDQGASRRDVDRTVRINQDIRATNINARNVEVATVNGRVTLRGWVDSEDDKRRIGEIAIAASRLELVDNQITVGRPLSAN